MITSFDLTAKEFAEKLESFSQRLLRDPLHPYCVEKNRNVIFQLKAVRATFYTILSLTIFSAVA